MKEETKILEFETENRFVTEKQFETEKRFEKKNETSEEPNENKSQFEIRDSNISDIGGIPASRNQNIGSEDNHSGGGKKRKEETRPITWHARLYTGFSKLPK